VLERNDGQVIAVEIKAGSRISGEDFRGLRQLKERLGPRLEEAAVRSVGVTVVQHSRTASRINALLDRLSRTAVCLTGAEPPAFRAVGVIDGICAHGRHASVIGDTVAARASRGSVYAASMVARTL
jgi:hypothetical protein